MAVRFWREDNIQRVELCRHPVASGYPGNLFGSISRLLSFISSGPNLVSVSGCPSAVLQALDQSNLFKHSVQFLFRFEVLSLPRLMHQKFDSFFWEDRLLLATEVSNRVSQQQPGLNLDVKLPQPVKG